MRTTIKQKLDGPGPAHFILKVLVTVLYTIQYVTKMPIKLSINCPNHVTQNTIFFNKYHMIIVCFLFERKDLHPVKSNVCVTI
jgi:hypothetical protein